MNWAIVVPTLLTIMSALCWVAYKHPNAYKKRWADALFGLCFMIALICTVFFFGMIVGATDMMGLAAEKASQKDPSFLIPYIGPSAVLPDWAWPTVIILFLLSYFCMWLQHLPALLDDDSKGADEESSHAQPEVQSTETSDQTEEQKP